MKCLISGGAGFVGSHLAEALVNLGHDVTVVDNYSTGHLKNLENIKCKIKPENICYLNENNGVKDFDVIFHLAAKPFSKAKNDWFAESQFIFYTNVVGTYNLLHLTNPKCHFIAVSSASVYGEGRYLSETTHFNPKSAYGYSKLVMEQVITNSPRNYTIVRPGTIIGARGRCFPNRLVWTSIHNQECQLFDDGNVLRDIVDVRDVVAALIKIMNKKIYGVFNLGSNMEISGFDLAKTFIPIAKHFKLKPTAKTTAFTPSDFVKVSTLNSNKLYQTLCWRPEYCLENSLTEIAKYYLSDTSYEPTSWENL